MVFEKKSISISADIWAKIDPFLLRLKENIHSPCLNEELKTGKSMTEMILYYLTSRRGLQMRDRIMEPIYQFQNLGEHTITLTVMDVDGDGSTTSAELYVNAIPAAESR